MTRDIVLGTWDSSQAMKPLPEPMLIKVIGTLLHHYSTRSSSSSFVPPSLFSVLVCIAAAFFSVSHCRVATGIPITEI